MIGDHYNRYMYIEILFIDYHSMINCTTNVFTICSTSSIELTRLIQSNEQNKKRRRMNIPSVARRTNV